MRRTVPAAAGRTRLSLGLLVAGLMTVVALAFGAGPAGAAGAATNVYCPGDDLQNAIDTAGYGDTIVVYGHCYGNYEINGSNGNSGHITIIGATSTTTLDGGKNEAVLDVFGGASPTIQNLRIVNGRDDTGGGVDIGDCGTTVNLVAVTVSNNVAYEDNGGGIYVECGNLNVTNSVISLNWASNDGGGIGASQDSYVTLTGTTIKNNLADDGGGIDVENSSLAATASTIANNVADGHAGDGRGGGIRASNSNVLLTSTKVTANKVTSSSDYFYDRGGGGIYFNGNFVPYVDAPIAVASTASGGEANGRAVPPVSDGLTLVNSSVDHNSSKFGDGGGIWALSGDGNANVTLTGSTVSFNTTPQGSGGGIANFGVCENTASVLATGSTFQGNQAANHGGAVYNVSLSDGEGCDPGTALVTVAKSAVATGSSVVNQNRASYGAGFFNDQHGGVASLFLQPGAKVMSNKATTNGGGVYNNCGASFSSLGQISLNTPNNVAFGCL